MKALFAPLPEARRFAENLEDNPRADRYRQAIDTVMISVGRLLPESWSLVDAVAEAEGIAHRLGALDYRCILACSIWGGGQGMADWYDGSRWAALTAALMELTGAARRRFWRRRRLAIDTEPAMWGGQRYVDLGGGQELRLGACMRPFIAALQRLRIVPLVLPSAISHGQLNWIARHIPRTVGMDEATYEMLVPALETYVDRMQLAWGEAGRASRRRFCPGFHGWRLRDPDFAAWLESSAVRHWHWWFVGVNELFGSDEWWAEGASG